MSGPEQDEYLAGLDAQAEADAAMQAEAQAAEEARAASDEAESDVQLASLRVNPHWRSLVGCGCGRGTCA